MSMDPVKAPSGLRSVLDGDPRHDLRQVGHPHLAAPVQAVADPPGGEPPGAHLDPERPHEALDAGVWADGRVEGEQAQRGDPEADGGDLDGSGPRVMKAHHEMSPE